jgi:L-lactate dehydrogenase complex protein LldG
MATFLDANPDITKESSNLVFIAGPSRTGDIEMTLTIGVHGPGEVHVIILP